MIGYPKKGYPDWRYGDVVQEVGGLTMMFVRWEKGEPKVFMGVQLRGGVNNPTQFVDTVHGQALGSRSLWQLIEFNR